MAPNKLEKDIKTQLNAREIQPSAQAWNRLDAMLSVAESNKNENEQVSKKFPWYLAAASFIGFVFITTIIKLNFEAPIDNNLPQTSYENPVVYENINEENTNENSIPEVQNQKKEVQTNKILSEINKSSSEKLIINRVSVIKNNQNQILKDGQNAKQNIVVELLTNEVKKQELISSQNQIAKTEIINFNPEILNSEPKKIKINASTLLSQVDDEVRNEYQQTIFQKIGTNFQAVKVAFVERNLKK